MDTTVLLKMQNGWKLSCPLDEFDFNPKSLLVTVRENLVIHASELEGWEGYDEEGGHLWSVVTTNTPLLE